jgi:hypothetical protein
VIIAQGGAFGGMSIYAKDGKPAFCYNLFGLQRFKVYGDGPIPAGTEFTGRVRWVQIDLGEDAKDADHLISPEERYRIAMARQ